MAVSIGVAPTLLIFFTIWAARADRLTPHLPAIALGAALAVVGMLLYPCTLLAKKFPGHSIKP